MSDTSIRPTTLCCHSTENAPFRATHPKAWCAARRAFPSNKLQTIQAETFAKLMERGRLVRILIQTEIRI